MFAFGGKAQLNGITFDHRLGATINRVVQLDDTRTAIVVGCTKRYRNIRLIPSKVILRWCLCGRSCWCRGLCVGKGVDADTARAFHDVDGIATDFDLTWKWNSP